MHIKFFHSFFCLIRKKKGLHTMLNVQDYFYICLELSSFLLLLSSSVNCIYPFNIYYLSFSSRQKRMYVWIRNICLLLIVRMKLRLMDVRVRARAKSTCLVCKRTRDHHHITLKYVWWLLLIYICMVLVGEPSKHAHTIDDPHLLRLFFPFCCYHNE